MMKAFADVLGFLFGAAVQLKPIIAHTKRPFYVDSGCWTQKSLARRTEHDLSKLEPEIKLFVAHVLGGWEEVLVYGSSDLDHLTPCTKYHSHQT